MDYYGQPGALKRVKRGWMTLRVSQIIDETPDTKTFRFVDAETGGQEFDYVPGQYVTFRYDAVGQKPVIRSYTMSSAPLDGPHIDVTVKRVENGLISNWMCDQLKIGDTLKARGPIGRFVFEAAKDKPHLVFTAGGSGVTPFLSIMKAYADILDQPHCPSQMRLLVSHRTAADVICADLLRTLQAKPGIQVVVTLTRDDTPSAHGLDFEHGRIDEKRLSDFLGSDLQNSTYFSCGPQAIMDLTSQFLQQKGVAESQVKLESFES